MTAVSWDDRYRGDGYFYGTEPNDFLKANAPRISAGPVLCLADGEGRNGVHLAERGHAVTSVDLSEVGLEKARALARSRGVTIETVRADLGTLAIAPGAWSAIVSVFCHLPSAARRRLHAAVAAGLAPGGVFLLEAYRPAQLAYKTGGPSDPDWLPTLAELTADFAALTAIHARETERDVVEGRGHTGRAAVVQFLAVRSR